MHGSSASVEYIRIDILQVVPFLERCNPPCFYSKLGAIDRFVAVVFPIKLGLISPKTRTAAIVSTWMFAGLFNSPSLIIVVVHDNIKAFCSNTSENPYVST